MNSTNSLIVPMQVHAMCAGARDTGDKDSEESTAKFAPPTADYRSSRTAVSGDVIYNPFEYAPSSSIEPGVHLHWFLPNALARAMDMPDSNEENLQPVFPVVPNRWLVTRMHTTGSSQQQPQVALKSWVVESDFLSKDSIYRNSANVPYPDKTKPFRYMGRAVPLDQWPDKLSRASGKSRAKRLTAVGFGSQDSKAEYGTPYFSVYYPNCKQVFGFHDALDDLEIGDSEQIELGYTVVGWYADRDEDPLYAANRDKSVGELLVDFNWAISEGGKIEDIDQLVCCGMIRLVSWHPDSEYISCNFDRNDTRVSVGNTVADALSALLAGSIKTKNAAQTAASLETLQAGQLDQLDKVDALADLTRVLHKNSFTPESAGILWTIEASATERNIRFADNKEIASQLDELNREQAEFNRRWFESSARKRQVFLDWYKYQLYKANPDAMEQFDSKGINENDFEKFIESSIEDAGEIEKLLDEIGDLKKSLESNLATQVGDEYRLETRVAPRYFRPSDPVILLAGQDIKPTLKHHPNAELPCILQDQLMRAAPVKNSTGNINLPDNKELPDCTKNLMAELLFIDSSAGFGQEEDKRSIFFDTRIAAISPAEIAINQWMSPWNPIFMHWRVEYQPLEINKSESDDDDGIETFPPDLITARFSLSEDTIDLNETSPSSRENFETYVGISVLSPHAVRSFERFAETYIDKAGEDSVVSDALAALKEVPVLSQALSGFHDALIMRKEQMQFPVDDPRIQEYVGERNQYAPVPNCYFNPVRAGRMNVDKIRMVDSFGQYRDIAAPYQIYAARNLTSSTGDKSKIFLPPRVVQPSRLLLRWLAANEAAMETSEHPASTPVCGWLMPNYLDQSLLIYDSRGQALGVVRSRQDGQTVFRNSPGGAAFSIRYQDESFGDTAEKYIAGNTILRNFVVSLLKHDARYLEAFVDTLDRALSYVEPEAQQDESLRALLTGRPVALARVSMKLDLKGMPAVNQSWNSLMHDIAGAAATNSSREHADFTRIEFPLRIGSPKETNEFNDGLIGYFQEATDQPDYDFGNFLSYHADGSNRYIDKPALPNLVITAAPDAAPKTLLVLLDPRAKLHITSGILPKKGILIPRRHYADSYESMEVSLLAAPLLQQESPLSAKGQEGINIPVAFDSEYQWTWLAKEEDEWSEQPAFSDKPDAISDRPAVITEGWLRLTKRETD